MYRQLFRYSVIKKINFTIFETNQEATMNNIKKIRNYITLYWRELIVGVVLGFGSLSIFNSFWLLYHIWIVEHPEPLSLCTRIAAKFVNVAVHAFLIWVISLFFTHVNWRTIFFSWLLCTIAMILIIFFSIQNILNIHTAQEFSNVCTSLILSSLAGVLVMIDQIKRRR